ncbi:hypothetical protein HYW75_05405 [Candidatus Pacearchaeota archaeon]|nr:hypothetical protein [Candidatus Pacearchaeota archaeon]
MGKITLNIPDDLEQELKISKLDVSRVVVSSIRNEVMRFIALKTLASKSKLTQEDAIELGKKIKELAMKR